jgi:lipopolysaccharide transport system permease protein
MLLVYSVVFSFTHSALKFPSKNAEFDLPIVLFCGIIVHNFFAESLSRAPGLVSTNIIYVKKIVFPLHILPIVSVGSAIIQFLIGMTLLILFIIVVKNSAPVAVFLVPLIMLPLVLFVLGVSWILASLGVYFRDIFPITTIALNMSLFLSPVFYPLDIFPALVQSIFRLNPITLPVIQLREILLYGGEINWASWTIELIVGLAIFSFGVYWFQCTRAGFADVS